MPWSLFVIVPILLIILMVLAAAIKIVKEYERGVVFRLGRLVGPRGPGLILLVPFVERMQKIDLRTVTLDVPAQEVITRDKVSIVEVKDVELPQTMQRAMARQAEAEREKRAKVIHAEGELEASQKLAQAAAVIDQNPLGIQLRYLQTLTEIGAEKNTTVVFPLPIDLIAGLFQRGNGTKPAPIASASEEVALG